jgi:LysM repeat protein
MHRKKLEGGKSMEYQGRICPRGASYYVWKAGDTAQSVAQASGTTVQALTVLNPDVNFSTLPAGTEIGTRLFQGKYFRNLNFTPEAVLQEIQKHDIRTVYLRLPVNNPDLLPVMLQQYQPVRNAFFALAKQGFCTIKPITRDGLIISFSKK